MGLDHLSTDELAVLDTQGLDALSTEALARLDQADEAEQTAAPAPASPMAMATGGFGRMDELIRNAAGKAGGIIAAPVDAAIKKVDESVAPVVQSELFTDIVAQIGSQAVGSMADEQLDGMPGAAKRVVKDVAAGAIGLGSGVGGGLRAMGFENIGSLMAKSAQQTAKELMPPDPNIIDQVAQGLGSMGAFMIPGLGVSTSAAAVATVAPRLAMFLGTATSSVLEAGVEAGEVYNRIMEKTGNKDEASVAASRAFFANLPLVQYTNKLGWAGDQATRAARALESFFTEGLQEGGQQFISNFAAHDPLMQEVVQSAFVGGIVGGMAGAAAHTPVKSVMESQPETPAVPPTPPAPPAAPAAPVAPAAPPTNPDAAPQQMTNPVPPGAAPAAEPAAEPVPPPIPKPEEIAAIPDPEPAPKKAKKGKAKKPKADVEEDAEQIDEDEAPAAPAEPDPFAALKAEALAENKALGEQRHPVGSEVEYEGAKGKKVRAKVVEIVPSGAFEEDGYRVVVKDAKGNVSSLDLEDLGLEPGEKAKALKAAKEKAKADEEAAYKAERDAEDAKMVELLTGLKAIHDKAMAAPKDQRQAIAQEYEKLYDKYREKASTGHYYYSTKNIRDKAGFVEPPPQSLLYRQVAQEEMDKSPEFQAAVKEAVDASSTRKEFREALAKIILDRDIPVSRMVLGQMAGTKYGRSLGIDPRDIYGHDTAGLSIFSGENQAAEMVRISEPMLKKMKSVKPSKEKAALLEKFAAKLEKLLPDTKKKGGKKKEQMGADKGKGRRSPGYRAMDAEQRAAIVEAARTGEISEDVVQAIVESGEVSSEDYANGSVSFRTKGMDINLHQGFFDDEFSVSKSNVEMMALAAAIDLKKPGLPPSVNEQSRARLVQWVREATVGWRGSDEDISDVLWVVENFTAPADALVKAVRGWQESGHHPAIEIVELRGEGIIKELGWPTHDAALYRQKYSSELETFKEIMSSEPDYEGHEPVSREERTRELVNYYDPVTDPSDALEDAQEEVDEAEAKLKGNLSKRERQDAEARLKLAKKKLAEVKEKLAKPGAVNPDSRPIEYTPEDIPAEQPVDPVENVVAQLEKAGYKPEQARTLGVIFEGFKNLADRAGVAAHTLFDRYAIKVVKSEAKLKGEGVTLEQGATGPVGRDLIIQHNLSAGKLIHAAKMGGIPVPSLAITKYDSPMESFGEITLIGPKELADPKGYANTKVFGADIYSPRYPRVNYKVDHKRVRALAEKLNFAKTGESDYSIESEIEDRGPEHLENLAAVMGAFLDDKKIAWKPVEGRSATGRNSVSDYQTRSKLRSIIESKGLSDEFQGFVRQMFNDLGVQERIFQGFSNAGNKRYKPHTLENVVAMLKKELRGGESEGNLYGVGQLRSKFTPQFKSVEAIRKAKDKIVPRAEFEKIKDEVNEEFFKIANELKSSYGSEPGFHYSDTVLAVMEEAPRIGLDRALAEYNFSDVSDSAKASISNFLEKLRGLPTEYFEAKVLRAVDISEFAAAVAPSNTSKEALSVLEKSGVKVWTYEKADPKDRARAVREASETLGERVLFQPAYHGTPHEFDKFDIQAIGTGEGNQTFGWGLYFAGRKAVAEYYRDVLARGAGPRVEQLSEYYKPGRIVPSYAGHDRVIKFYGPDEIPGQSWLVEVQAVQKRGGEWVNDPMYPRPRRHATMPSTEAFERITGKKLGRLYKVEIPEDSEYLDWFKPLSEQSEKVQRAVESSGIKALPTDNGSIVYGMLSQRALRYDDNPLNKLFKEQGGGRQEKAASLYLASKGVAGIKYLDEQSRNIRILPPNESVSGKWVVGPSIADRSQQKFFEPDQEAEARAYYESKRTNNYVVFDDKLVKIMEYEQKAMGGDQPRGRLRIKGREFTIEMLEGADLSTFIHEAGHLYLEVLGDIAADPAASPEIKADYDTILAWLGADSQSMAAAVGLSRPSITVEQHEQFARGFEAYLMEGKAPISRLQAAFDTFKSWLVAIYKQLSALDVELTPEVRRVFDRIMASDAEIAVELQAAEKALARARKRKASADSQAPPAVPQDAAPAAKVAVVEEGSRVKKAKQKAKPVAVQSREKAADGSRIMGVKRSLVESLSEIGALIDSKEPMLQLKPTQLEKYANAGLLDAEFRLTPLARDAVAEFRRVKDLLKQGFVEDISVYEPKKLTLKAILKDIANLGRFALFATYETGWLTDSRIAFRTMKEDESAYAPYRHLAKGHNAPQLEQVLKGTEPATDLVIGIAGVHELNAAPVYLLQTEGGRQLVVAAHYYNFFKERYPEAKFYGQGERLPLKVEVDGQMVGALMPMDLKMGGKYNLYSIDGTKRTVEMSAGRIAVDEKMGEIVKVRAKLAASKWVYESNLKELREMDNTPGEKTAALIEKIANLQKENLGVENEMAELTKQIATLEEQAAALREQHGIQDIPASGLVRKGRPKGGKGGGRGASSGDFAYDTPVEMGGMEHIKPFRMPELVRLAYELMGKVPEVGGLRKYNGYFKGVGGGEIKLNPIIFQKPEQAAKTLAHEIGHLIDYLPDHTLKRGNMLGSLKSLHSHLANTFGTLQITNKDLRDELMAVTMYWRPWDPESSTPGYNSYRKSARELYADAISVLLNSPGTLERMAPKFYRGFFESLDAKPAVKIAFFDLQKLLNAPEMDIQEARHLDRKAMYMSAEDLWAQKRKEQQLRESHYGEWFRQLLVEKYQKVIGKVEAAASKGQVLPPSADPRYILEELSLSDNNNHAFLEEVDAKIVKPLLDAEVTLLDMGDYLYLSRVALGDRQAFANPKGYNPEEAKKALDFMATRLGSERYGKLQAAAAAFREIVFNLSEQAVAVGAYSQQVFNEKIKPNRGSYAVFAVQEHLEDYIAAGVKEQIGTLKDIANPFTATVMKMVALNRLIAKQKAAIAVRDFLLSRGEAEKAQALNPQDNLVQFRKRKGSGLLEMLENGSRTAYYVDPYIAEAFEKKEAGTFHLAVKVLDSIFNGIFRPLYITFNIGFQLYSNPIRDFARTRRNVYALVRGQGYVGTVKSLIFAYWDSLAPGARRALDIPDALVSEMIANKALDVTFTDFSFDPDADQYTAILRRMGVAPPQRTGLLDRISKLKILAPVTSILEGIRFIGNAHETASKIAGYKVLKADMLKTLDRAIAAEKDPEQKAFIAKQRALLAKGEGEYAHRLAYNTRNYVGTPNWRRRGTISKISNTLFPFSNIMIQGMRSDLEIATRPETRTGFMLDMVVTQVLPKLLMLMAALGGAGDDGEEFFRKVSEYDKSNYIIIPMGWSEDGKGGRKAVYWRIPHDESGRLIAAVFWKFANALRGDPAALQQIVDFGAGQLPSIAPPITIGANWLAFLSGKNPYDDFRGRPILSDKAFQAGGSYALTSMVQWTINEIGLASFATHDPAKKSGVESLLEVAPLLNRVIKVSDYGEHEEDMKVISEKQADDAALSLDRGEAAKAYTKERYILTQKMAADEISTDERVRLARLNKYYPIYLTYTKAIKRANEKGDEDKVEHYREKLDSILAKVVE
jgi:hypothetical protein